MNDCLSLPLSAAERKVAREFKRYGATLLKIRPKDQPGPLLFALGATDTQTHSAGAFVATADWNVILVALLGARASGIRLSAAGRVH